MEENANLARAKKSAGTRISNLLGNEKYIEWITANARWKKGLVENEGVQNAQEQTFIMVD